MLIMTFDTHTYIETPEVLSAPYDEHSVDAWLSRGKRNVGTDLIIFFVTVAMTSIRY